MYDFVFIPFTKRAFSYSMRIRSFSSHLIRRMSGRESTKKAKNAAPKGHLLKILMIHGYRQNEMAFRERSGGIRKALKGHAEFVFCEAPHVISEQKEPDGAGYERGWWFGSTEPATYDAHEFTSVDLKFEETLKYLNSVFEASGPFDGILGSFFCLSLLVIRGTTWSVDLKN